MIVYATASPGEIRAVAAQDGRILDVAIERPGRPGGVGDRHRGRVLARMPALAGSFVALEGAEGFLPDSAAPPGLSEGDAVMVRIVRAAQGGKGPRLDASGLSRPEPGPPTRLARGPGAVERLAALHPGAPVRVDTPGLLAALRPLLAERVGQAPFPAALLDELDGLAAPGAVLDGGVRASFHPTPALVAIDLDMARATGDRRGKVAGQFAANQQALPDLARHIRARNLSGAIVVDLAGLSPKRRAALGPALAAALATDPGAPRFLGFTALGLAEIVRPRVYPPLHELLAGAHAAGLAALRHLAGEQNAMPGTALAVRAAPDVCAALRADSVATADLVHETGRHLMLECDQSLPPGRWIVEEMPRA